MIIIYKIYAVLFILDILVIYLGIESGKSRRAREGEEILNQIYQSENETV